MVPLRRVLPLMAVLGATLTPAQEPQVFRAGTRLVEVEVVVRDKNGPVKNLTRDDFAVLDQGKPQAIAIFRNSATTRQAISSSAPLPAGTVSNRQDSRGRPLDGATVVLLDQLNTKIDYKAYERKQMVKFLRALSETDRIALYSLGKDLHILQDFTTDPQKLIDGIAKVDGGLDQRPDYVGDGAGAGGALVDAPVDDCNDFGPGAAMCRRSALGMAGVEAP
jgi:VWFA-related protein